MSQFDTRGKNRNSNGNSNGNNKNSNNVNSNKNNNNSNDINNILDTASKRLGTDKDTVENVAKSGDLQKLLKNMNPEQLKKIQSILNDKDQADKLLNTPQAKALLKKFMPNNNK